MAEHGISPEEYFEKYCMLERPICKCGICNKPSNIVLDKQSNFKWREFVCGRFPGLLEWSENAKTNRRGDGNPMYQKKPWNKNLTKDINESVMSSSIKNTGRFVSDETRKKQSASAKKRLIHGHSGRHHTDETKQFLRENTLRLIKEGVFRQTKTRPHIAMAKILDSIGVRYEEEKTVSCWSIDFYLIDYDIYLEVDGDYFHSNPKIYPNGPKTKLQKRNRYRDNVKNKFFEDSHKIFYRFWECDILNNTEDIKCRLKELLGLSI